MAAAPPPSEGGGGGLHFDFPEGTTTIINRNIPPINPTTDTAAASEPAASASVTPSRAAKTDHAFKHGDKAAAASERALTLTEPLRNMGIFEAMHELCEERKSEPNGLRVLQLGCGCLDGSAPETLELLLYATVPVHLTVLDYNQDALDIAQHCTRYPLPLKPAFCKPTADAGADADDSFGWLGKQRREALAHVFEHTQPGTGTEAARFRVFDRTAFERANGHCIDGVCASFVSHDFGTSNFDLIIAFNSLFYAMNDSSVDEHALFQRVLSALKPAGGRFITDRTTSALVSHAVFDDVVISKLGKGVNATSVFTRK